MWRKIDYGIVDRLVISLGSSSIAIARRLGYIDTAIDNRVTSVGSGTNNVGHWLGRYIDPKAVSRAVEATGHVNGTNGRTGRNYEPHSMQHNLLIIVIWLVAALGFFYWIAG